MVTWCRFGVTWRRGSSRVCRNLRECSNQAKLWFQGACFRAGPLNSLDRVERCVSGRSLQLAGEQELYFRLSSNHQASSCLVANYGSTSCSHRCTCTVYSQTAAHPYWAPGYPVQESLLEQCSVLSFESGSSARVNDFSCNDTRPVMCESEQTSGTLTLIPARSSQLVVKD